MLLGQWGRYVIQIVSLAVLARILEPADFGEYAVVAAVLAVASILTDAGTTLSGLQVKRLSQGEASGLFWINLCLGSVSATLMILVGIVLAATTTDDWSLFYLGAAVPVLLSLGAQSRVALLRNQRYARLVAMETTSQIAGVAAAISLAIIYPSGLPLVIQQVVAAGTCSGLYFLSSGWRPGIRVEIRVLRRHIAFARRTLLVQLANVGSSAVEVLALSAFNPAHTVGYYNRGAQLAYIPAQQMTAPLTRIVMPRFARLPQSEFVCRFAELQFACVYCATLAFGALFLHAPDIVTLALGEGWQGANDVVRILAVGCYFQMAGLPLYWAALARDETRALVVTEVPIRLLLIAFLFLASIQGVEWVAGAVASSQLAILALSATSLAGRLGVSATRIFAPTFLLPSVFLAVSVSVMAIWTQVVGEPSTAVASLGAAVLAMVLFLIATSPMKPVAAMVRSRGGLR